MSDANSIQPGGNHYQAKGGGEQHWDRQWKTRGRAWFIGNVTKYVERYDSKNGFEDLAKLYHYLVKLLELEVAATKGTGPPPGGGDVPLQPEGLAKLHDIVQRLKSAFEVKEELTAEQLKRMVEDAVIQRRPTFVTLKSGLTHRPQFYSPEMEIPQDLWDKAEKLGWTERLLAHKVFERHAEKLDDTKPFVQKPKAVPVGNEEPVWHLWQPGTAAAVCGVDEANMRRTDIRYNVTCKECLKKASPVPSGEVS